MSLAENLYSAEGLESRGSKIQVLVKKGTCLSGTKNSVPCSFVTDRFHCII